VSTESQNAFAWQTSSPESGSLKRFIAFVLDRNEMEEYAERYPGFNFTFVSSCATGEKVIALDPADVTGTVSFLYECHKQNPFTGVVNRKERFVIPTAAVSERLGFPRILENPYLARDKYLMNKILSAHGLSVQALLLPDGRDEGQCHNISYPCVIKPRFGVNSMCVTKIGSQAGFKKVLSEQRKGYELLKHFDFQGYDLPNYDFIAEPFVGGTEHTVEIFFKDKEAKIRIVSDKLKMQPPYFLEVGDIMPSRLGEAERNEVLATAAGACRTLGIENGWTHTEVKVQDGKPLVMEVAARMAGGYFEKLVRAVYGIDMTNTLIGLYTGRRIENPGTPRKCAVAKRVTTDGVRVMLGVTGYERYIKEDFFRLVDRRTLRGRSRVVIGPPYGYDNTLLEYFILADTYESALTLSRKLFDRITVRSIRVPPPLYRSLRFLKRVTHLFRREGPRRDRAFTRGSSL